MLVRISGFAFAAKNPERVVLLIGHGDVARAGIEFVDGNPLLVGSVTTRGLIAPTAGTVLPDWPATGAMAAGNTSAANEN
jgi:hypothetical protein